MKNSRDFYLKSFSFLEVKFSIYLNRHVFVMVSRRQTDDIFFYFYVENMLWHYMRISKETICMK